MNSSHLKVLKSFAHFHVPLFMFLFTFSFKRNTNVNPFFLHYAAPQQPVLTDCSLNFRKVRKNCCFRETRDVVAPFHEQTSRGLSVPDTKENLGLLPFIRHSFIYINDQKSCHSKKKSHMYVCFCFLVLTGNILFYFSTDLC